MCLLLVMYGVQNHQLCIFNGDNNSNKNGSASMWESANIARDSEFLGGGVIKWSIVYFCVADRTAQRNG